MNPRTIFELLKETFTEWQQDKASRLAAALAYYTIFSLSPLLVIAVAIAGAVFGEEAAKGQIVGQIEGLVGTEGATVIQTAIENASQPDVSNVASWISIIVLFFGASGVFAQLQDALNTVWNVEPKPGGGIIGFITKRILSFSMVLVIGFLLLVSLVLSAALSALGNFNSNLLPEFSYFWQILNQAISFGIIIVLFAMIYKYLPDVKISWSDVWIGAFITSLLFVIGKYALGLYLGRSSLGSTYGAAGSLIVLLAWVYYSAMILFFGAEFTQVYAARYGSKIVPDDDAVSVNPETPSRRRRYGSRRRRNRR